jgi:hypothetical protein
MSHFYNFRLFEVSSLCHRTQESDMNNRKYSLIVLALWALPSCGSGTAGSSTNPPAGTDASIADSKSSSSPFSGLAHPPDTTKGFTECGTVNGKPLYCQPGTHCDVGATQPCNEECLSSAACPSGYTCKKPDGITNLHKFCLPVGTPKTSSGKKAGFSFCGYRNGEVFACAPGSYCDDPISNRCAKGCLTYINCGEGEYCDQSKENAYWKGGCTPGKPSKPPSGGPVCPAPDTNCCCVQREYYRCASPDKVDQCVGAGLQDCLDACAAFDAKCHDDCFSKSSPNPSVCTRNSANDSHCSK